MTMKKFLTTFAAIAAGFATQAATAAVPKADDSVPESAKALHGPTSNQSGAVAVRNDAGDQFNFVLKRSGETGQMMAYHESHASHASHASHHSHYSSR